VITTFKSTSASHHEILHYENQIVVLGKYLFTGVAKLSL